MSDDPIGDVITHLTWNGAYNLRNTLLHPHETHPDLINGGKRISTGLGKWTHIAATGVIRHLLKMEVVEHRYIDWNNDGRGWESLVITPLGREVAERLIAEWETLAGTFRDAGSR